MMSGTTILSKLMPKRPKSIDLSKALAEVSNPPKPKRVGPQKNKKPPLPQKKRTSSMSARCLAISRNSVRESPSALSRVTHSLLPSDAAHPRITPMSGTVPPSAMIALVMWARLVRSLIFRVLLCSILVRIATKVALGYEYEEEKQESMPEYDESGQPTGKYILGKKTINIKRERDTALLKFLLACRMPEYFMERKEIKIDKRVVELREDARAEITEFCSGLLKAIGGNVSDVEFVDRVEETEK